MRSVTIAVLLATVTIASSLTHLDLVEDLIAEPSSVSESSSLPPPPVKLDKTLRRALLKALVDLEADSAEQHQKAEREKQQQQEQQDKTRADDGQQQQQQQQQQSEEDEEEAKYDFLEISRQKSASFTFDGFPSEDDTPSEDKLQNSSFVETDKYAQTEDGDDKRQSAATSSSQRPPQDYTKGVQVHHVVPSEKSSAIYETKPAEQLESVESRNVASNTASSTGSSTTPSDLNLIQKSVTFAPIVETLSVSASGNVAAAAANSLVAPRPTASTLSHKTFNGTKVGAGSKLSGVQPKSNQEGAEEVKIFQAPLVAAFTVQQDERGVPKSVVPLFRTVAPANGTLSLPQVQPLSLQEQLEFKQRLLEKQLAHLQAQQAQQTSFLLRQRQAYEEQLRLKQQQEFFQQEQRRLKLLQEQEQQQRLLQQQRFQQQFPPLQRPPQQSFQQPPQLPTFQQPPQPQVQQVFSQQPNFKTTSVQLQPSLTLEVPSVAPAPIFQQNLRQQLLPPQQQQQQQQQPQLPQQQQHQQSLFPVEFQQPPAVAPLARFNRQEAFNSIGNFGFNGFQNNDKNNGGPIRNSINPGQFVQQPPPLALQQRLPHPNNNFVFNANFRPQQQQQRPFLQAGPTPARQIQELLYQSGIAGDLQGAGTRNQEDINIVSKVLALNVGSLPGQRTNGFQQQQSFAGLKK